MVVVLKSRWLRWCVTRNCQSGPRLASRIIAPALMTMSCVTAAQSMETVWIPLPSAQSHGRAPIQLEATIYRPKGPGPFPVVIFSHGSSGGPIPASYTETAKSFAAFLNERHIALVIPMRSGRGKSEGDNNEEPSRCTTQAASSGIDNASAALRATTEFLRTQHWAAMHAVILAGHSRGGLLSVVYAANHPAIARGVINFAGGWKNDTCGAIDVNTPLFAQAGQKSTVPNLFIYGHGDGFYADSSIQAYVAAFKDSGADVDFRFYTLEGINGHAIFHKGLPLWKRDLDAFFIKLGIIKQPAQL